LHISFLIFNLKINMKNISSKISFEKCLRNQTFELYLSFFRYSYLSFSFICAFKKELFVSERSLWTRIILQLFLIFYLLQFYYMSKLRENAWLVNILHDKKFIVWYSRKEVLWKLFKKLRGIFWEEVSSFWWRRGISEKGYIASKSIITIKDIKYISMEWDN